MRKLYADNKLVFLKDTNRALPVGFTEVEYLQSSGTQYIDTLWTPTSNNLRVKFKVKSMGSPLGTAICGAEKNGITPRWVFILYGQSGDSTKTFPLTGDWNNTSSDTAFTFTSGTTLEIDWTTSSTSTTITDKVTNTSFTRTFGSTMNYSNNTVSLKLFQNSNTQKSSIQMNYYQIWDNGIFVRDFVPCLDRNNTPCLWDFITRKAYYNQGTGEFTYGREIYYTRWLESTGTQYINTGIYLTNNHTVEVDYQLTIASQSRKGIYGGLIANGARHGALTSPSNQYLEAGYGSTNVYYQLGLPDTKRHVLKQAKNELYFDGKLIYTFGTATFTQNFTAPLGNFNYTNYNPVSAKYYGSRWWDGDTLVRDFQPAIDENGLGFWFDRVTHTCFLNAGTGDFKYAPVECEYLEVTGLGTTGNRPCLDLGIKYKPSMSIEGKYTRTAMGDSGSVLPLSTSTTNPVLYFPALNANAKTDRFVWRRGGYNEQNYYYSFSDYPFTVNFKLDAVNDELYVNGSKVKTGMIAGMNGYSSPYESASNLYMLSIAGNYGGLGKVYPLKIYDTTQVYRDLIPAWKDGSYGMYDKEHDVLYTNIKGGTIAIGKIKDKRPSAIRLIKEQNGV